MLVFLPLLWLNHSLLYACTTFGLPIYQLIDVSVVSTFFAVINNTAVNTGVDMCFQFPWLPWCVSHHAVLFRKKETRFLSRIDLLLSLQYWLGGGALWRVWFCDERQARLFTSITPFTSHNSYIRLGISSPYNRGGNWQAASKLLKITELVECVGAELGPRYVQCL